MSGTVYLYEYYVTGYIFIKYYHRDSEFIAIFLSLSKEQNDSGFYLLWKYSIKNIKYELNININVGRKNEVYTILLIISFTISYGFVYFAIVSAARFIVLTVLHYERKWKSVQLVIYRNITFEDYLLIRFCYLITVRCTKSRGRTSW